MNENKRLVKRREKKTQRDDGRVVYLPLYVIYVCVETCKSFGVSPVFLVLCLVGIDKVSLYRCLLFRPKE